MPGCDAGFFPHSAESCNPGYNSAPFPLPFSSLACQGSLAQQIKWRKEERGRQQKKFESDKKTLQRDSPRQLAPQEEKRDKGGTWMTKKCQNLCPRHRPRSPFFLPLKRRRRKEKKKKHFVVSARSLHSFFFPPLPAICEGKRVEGGGKEEEEIPLCSCVRVAETRATLSPPPPLSFTPPLPRQFRFSSLSSGPLFSPCRAEDGGQKNEPAAKQPPTPFSLSLAGLVAFERGKPCSPKRDKRQKPPPLFG